jgi:CDP-diacylglycerol pyrophosphatase
MAVSVNSLYGRSQDLLHLHVDCLTPAARAAIAALAPKLGRTWSNKPFEIVGHRYLALRLDGEAPAADPFRLLAAGVPGARARMGAWTLVMAGVEVRGRPGFVLLAGRADPLRGEFASGEVLQDHDCALAHGG